MTESRRADRIEASLAPDPLERPFDASTSVREARDAYLDENGFSLADYAAESVTVKGFGLTVKIPNGENRKWAIPLHDLHHVATGYGSDLVGEAEIGAFELAAGCRRPVTYVLNGLAMSLGLLLSPARVARAFRAGLRSRTLYRHPYEYEALLAVDVGTLREHLAVPRDGWADRPRKLHEDAWKAHLARKAAQAVS